MGYYRTDDIYQSWVTFVKTIPAQKIKKEDEFAKAQEACRKSFRRLTSSVCHCSWSGLFLGQKNLNNIMTYCVILYNMIIEDERDLNLKFFYDNIDSRVKPQRRFHWSIS
jgi:hypothetical protein